MAVMYQFTRIRSVNVGSDIAGKNDDLSLHFALLVVEGPVPDALPSSAKESVR